MWMNRFVIAILLYIVPIWGFDKVVIWGHKLGTHTHSYIHYGFFRAFQELGYPTFWFDGGDDVGNFDFSNTLFLTEDQVDQHIPIRLDSFYILHLGMNPRYEPVIKARRAIYMMFYNGEVLSCSSAKEYAPYVYFDLVTRFIHFPWATDLLPFEIDQMKEKLKMHVPKKQACYLGTISSGGPGENASQILPFLNEADQNGFMIITNDPWSRPLSPSVYQQLTQDSLLAPAIQGREQLLRGYIPCRIFKNISYGCLGITNSPTVYELFGRKIVYDSNSETLFYKALGALKTHTMEAQFELMDFIRDHHTYIQRAEALLEFIQQIQAYDRTQPDGSYIFPPEIYWKNTY
jgi:hypothetical protein